MRAECGVLFDALFLFEGASLEGERKRHRAGNNIYSLCQADREYGRMRRRHLRETLEADFGPRSLLGM